MTELYIHGIMETKSDDVIDDDGDHDAYEPLPYRLGDVCERCWLSSPHPYGGDLVHFGWRTYDGMILRPVGQFGCPHGEAP